ncbi:UDP-Glycosyltransferase superfamily protein [Forsythia ovata]|uniref:UDP-Glycosyltransferase superfamily protein n=1 Tax=Forsythia ovata TaxID=205694 RepID=A0ABD1UUT3_9LAMI
MITYGFLGWTLDSAQKFGIPRLVYYGMSNYSVSLTAVASQSRQLTASTSWNQYTLITGIGKWDRKYGALDRFVWRRRLGKKQENYQTPSWIQWLDRKQEEGKPVLYVAFGSQADISREQIKQIKTGLEKSGVNFLWVVGKNQVEDDDGFEYRVKDRGMLVKEWVDQREILEHSSVQGFLSHCGWNSVMESICAKVPILAWPMMAEQPLNAKMVVEEIGIGLRVETSDGSMNGFVKWEKLEKVMKELMEGEMGKQLWKKVKQVGGAAAEAVAEGGSSWNALNELINELHAQRD